MKSKFYYHPTTLETGEIAIMTLTNEADIFFLREGTITIQTNLLDSSRNKHTIWITSEQAKALDGKPIDTEIQVKCKEAKSGKKYLVLENEIV